MIMTANRLWAAAAVAIAMWLLINTAAENKDMTRAAKASGAKLYIEGELPSLKGTTAWLNSQLSATDLRGRVVLVQFWTYTCINWRRTLPYVRGWAEKYKDQGL